MHAHLFMFPCDSSWWRSTYWVDGNLPPAALRSLFNASAVFFVGVFFAFWCFNILHCQKQSGHVSMPQPFSWIVKKMKYQFFLSFNTDFSTSAVFMRCFVKTITKMMKCLLISIFSLPSLSTAVLHDHIFSHNMCNTHKPMIFNNCWQYYQ